MINKNQFNVQNTRKVLHKVSKHWVVVSAVVLGLLSGGTALTSANLPLVNASTVHSSKVVHHGTNRINIGTTTKKHHKLTIHSINHKVSVAKENVTRAEVNAVTAPNNHKTHNVKKLQKAIAEYKDALNVQKQFVHKTNTLKHMDAVKKADNQVHKAENELHQAHGKKAVASAQDNLKRVENNFLATVKGSVKSNLKNSFSTSANTNTLKSAKAHIIKAQNVLKHAKSKRSKLSARNNVIKAVHHYNKLVKQYNINIFKVAKHNVAVNKKALRYAHGIHAKRVARHQLHQSQATYNRLAHEMRISTKHGKHSIHKASANAKSYHHSKRSSHKSSHKRNE